MPQIMPIRDLKNTGNISRICHESKDPIFITKNGYGDMVIMSMEVYEETMFMNDVISKLAEAEEQFKTGDFEDAGEAMKKLRQKYSV